VVDGIDGSGKTTIARWIKDHYQDRGDRVLVQVHPSERLVGQWARRSLQSKGLHMYVLSSLFYIIDVITSVMHLPRWRRKYDEVIFVRYLMGTAYLPKRYAKLGYDIFASFLPVPSHLLLVDVSPEVALQRMAMREDKEEMFENLPALVKAREKVMMLSSGWTVLDNNDGESQSRARLVEILRQWDGSG
jgi:dTMP kinase